MQKDDGTDLVDPSNFGYAIDEEKLAEIVKETKGSPLPAIKPDMIANDMTRRERTEMIKEMLTCVVCKGFVRPKLYECPSCESIVCGPCAQSFMDTNRGLPCCCSRKKIKPINRKLRALVFDRLRIWHKC